MRRLFFFSLLLLLMLALPSMAAVIWDYGPGTGTPYDVWGNSYSDQRFAEQVLFGRDVLLSTYLHYSDRRDFRANAYRLEIWADNAGKPGTVLVNQVVTATSAVELGTYVGQVFEKTTPLVEIRFDFLPIHLSANTTYWLGLTTAALTGEAAQWGIMSPGDGKMAQFQGAGFVAMANVGDQMFKLLGTELTPIPEPSTYASVLTALTAGFALWRRRRTR